jgi:glutamine amidotransferase
MQTIALIDYGAGNLRSAQRALIAAGAARVELTDKPSEVRDAARIVLPGQGAFAACMAALAAREGLIEALEDAVLRRGTPFLGICVGMQLLADVGLEHGSTRGLGWIGGECRELKAVGERLPHMGWNEVRPVRTHFLFDALAPQRHAYFAHSYVLSPASAADTALATTHGETFVSAIVRDNIAGVQFHPEKSQQVGLALLARFLEWEP